MDASVIASSIAGVGVILTAWLGFMGNKKGTLATAESSFRTTVIEENTKLRERMEKLEQKLSNVMIENVKLKTKIARLEAKQIPQASVTTNVSEDSVNEGGDA